MEKKAPQQSESRDADKYIVRLPDGVRDRIAEVARENKRSMNAEIVEAIEKHLRKFNPLVASGKPIEDGWLPSFITQEELPDEAVSALSLVAADNGMTNDQYVRYVLMERLFGSYVIDKEMRRARGVKIEGVEQRLDEAKKKENHD